MNNDIILETLKVQPLSEEDKTSRHILKRLVGPIASCKEATRNGRKYNRELWESALNDDIFKEKLGTKGLLLELGHPADREDIDLTQVCACIPEMPKIIDDDLYATIEVLDSPNGRLLSNLIDYGFVPGISSRGSGDVMDNDEVDPSTFCLETWDIVNVPALKKARMQVVESLNKQSNGLRKALCESLNNATDKDRKIMQEALNRLDIKLDDKEPNESIPEMDGDKLSKDENVEIKENIKEVSDTESNNVIKDLQEALVSKTFLESQVDELQNKLAVNDIEVNKKNDEIIKLNEQLSKYKNAIADLSTKIKNTKELEIENSSLKKQLEESKQEIERGNIRLRRLSESRKSDSRSLNESISNKDQTIKKLNEEIESINTSKEKQIKELTESLENVKADSKLSYKTYQENLNKQKSLVEKYSKIIESTVTRYIDFRAKMLGVRSTEIRNKLSENYSLNDIDEICEELRTHEVNMSKLPFTFDRKVKVKVKESLNDPLKPHNEDDEIDEQLLKISGTK